MTVLHNKINRQELREKLMAEPFNRITLSFYRYVKIVDPEAMRDTLWKEWTELGVFGRIYLAKEGINAQISVPEQNWETFKEALYARPEFKDVPFKIAVEDDGKSFFLLKIKVKHQIVADGLAEDEYDVTNVGTHLDAEGFNAKLEEGAVVVDMRNQYESEIGHFEGAICPDVDTFREELPAVKKLLEEKGQKEKDVLLYCTGGIRCEKASAYLKHHGFKNVHQLDGGVIQYAKEVERKNLDCKFKGKNFVFDERIAERITEDVLSECHQCGSKCDTHVNCNNLLCNLLFLQCDSCAQKFEGCCRSSCVGQSKLTKDERKKLVQDPVFRDKYDYKKQIRPELKCEKVCGCV